MDDIIQIYRCKYPKGLSRQLGLDQEHLPTLDMTLVLLNPMFSLKPTLIATKLMTESQYDKARNDIVSSFKMSWISPILHTIMTVLVRTAWMDPYQRQRMRITVKLSMHSLALKSTRLASLGLLLTRSMASRARVQVVDQSFQDNVKWCTEEITYLQAKTLLTIWTARVGLICFLSSGIIRNSFPSYSALCNERCHSALLRCHPCE